jgi:Sec-independent protein secretion pathway component TatC
MLVQFGILPLGFVSGWRKKATVYAVAWLAIWIFGPNPTPITATIIMAPFSLVLEIALLFAKRIDKSRAGISETHAVSAARPASSKCRFCGGSMSQQSPFCAACSKSQV